MRKAVIVIAIGISLIIGGGVVTAFELTSWTPYDLDENVANFKKETIKTDISFEQLQTEKMIISNGYHVDFEFDDFIEGDSDYIEVDYDYYFNDAYYEALEFVEDEKQEVGTVSIEYTYLAPFNGEECGIDSLTYGRDNSRTEYRSHVDGRGNMRNTRSSRYDSINNKHRNVDEDTTYVFPQCHGFRGFGIGFNSRGEFYKNGFTEELKAIFKHKQLPLNTSRMKVTINPQDSNRVLSR